MEKVLVPVVGALLVVIMVVAGFVLNSGPLVGEDTQSATAESAQPSECEVAEYAMGVRWQQQGAEAQALQGQTYGFAAQALDEAVSQAPEGEALAIITDLDETAIDNSALLARDIAHCHDYTEWDTWSEWEKTGDPTLIPGALDFFTHADELGVDIFYISDRTEENLAHSIDTLQTLGLPQVSEETVKLLGPPKADRRAMVEADHTVLMQLGDTLHDFDDAFADAPLEEQRRLVEANREKFGTEWIVLPNPTYGDWAEAELEEWDAPLRTEG